MPSRQPRRQLWHYVMRAPPSVLGSKRRKAPVLSAEEARALIDAIDTSTVIGLRGRALMGLMVYTFTRVGAAIQLRVQDVYVQAIPGCGYLSHGAVAWPRGASLDN